MIPEQVKQHYGTLYRFNKETKMSCNSLANWLKWGYIPLLSQIKLEALTHGQLKSEWKKI